MLALALLFFRRLVDMDILRLEFTDGFQGSRAFRKSRALAACKTLQARTSCVAPRIISPSVAVGRAPRALTFMFRSTNQSTKNGRRKNSQNWVFQRLPSLEPLGRDGAGCVRACKRETDSRRARGFRVDSAWPSVAVGEARDAESYY